MISRVLLIFKYFLFWLVYFLFLKIVFLVFYLNSAKSLSIGDFFGIFWHGLKLDNSAAAYLLVLPVFLSFVLMFFKSYYFSNFLKWYTYSLIFIISLLFIGDLELYKYWGFRLDASAFIYINTPKDMLASVEFIVIIRQLIIYAIIVLGFIYLYKIFIDSSLKKLNKGNIYELSVLPFLIFGLIFLIRGGLGTAPVNTGTAYFSKNEFANHAAINMIWNLEYSFTEHSSIKNPYELMKEVDAKRIVSQLKPNNDISKKLLSSNKPNILIILVESFTAKAIESLGGEKVVTPNFDKLTKEGVLFTNFYSTGDRSDKGIVSLISGFPSLPISSIMKFPNKTESLPFLTKDLISEGYSTAFFYGGDIDFASMRSYLNNGGFGKIVSVSDFADSTKKTNWGVPDGTMFNHLLKDIDGSKSPFMYMYFTLSSHEPFDVPMKTEITGKDDDHKFLNSINYVDKCLGAFIENAKTKSWWKNTLIIITADHGSRLPGNTENYLPLRFHIPMLWLGGALRAKDTVVTKLSSQNDIALTLLKQLNIIPRLNYKYSNDIMSASSNEYAFYAYNNGFGFMTENTKVAFDFSENSEKIKEGIYGDSVMILGKAYLQLLYNDFVHRNVKESNVKTQKQ